MKKPRAYRSILGTQTNSVLVEWPWWRAVVIQLTGIGNGLVDRNVINLNSLYSAPISQSSCASTSYFKNQSFAGSLVQGYDSDSSKSFNETTIDADLGVAESG